VGHRRKKAFKRFVLWLGDKGLALAAGENAEGEDWGERGGRFGVRKIRARLVKNTYNTMTVQKTTSSQ